MGMADTQLTRCRSGGWVRGTSSPCAW